MGTHDLSAWPNCCGPGIPENEGTVETEAQAADATTAPRRHQRAIFLEGAVLGGRPQNGVVKAGWLAQLGGAGLGWAYKWAGCNVPYGYY